LTSITRHRAIDQLRRRGSRPEQHSMSWAELAPGIEPSVNGPEQATTLAMDRTRVRAAIDQLSEEQKQVLALAYFHQGLTQSQIAETLDLPLGTANNHRQRRWLGMRHLEGALFRSCDD
jgi:RNA polymerase sigma-70 factor (ECF subfamily)